MTFEVEKEEGLLVLKAEAIQYTSDEELQMLRGLSYRFRALSS